MEIEDQQTKEPPLVVTQYEGPMLERLKDNGAMPEVQPVVAQAATEGRWARFIYWMGAGLDIDEVLHLSWVALLLAVAGWVFWGLAKLARQPDIEGMFNRASSCLGFLMLVAYGALALSVFSSLISLSRLSRSRYGRKVAIFAGASLAIVVIPMCLLTVWLRAFPFDI